MAGVISHDLPTLAVDGKNDRKWKYKKVSPRKVVDLFSLFLERRYSLAQDRISPTPQADRNRAGLQSRPIESGNGKSKLQR